MAKLPVSLSSLGASEWYELVRRSCNYWRKPLKICRPIGSFYVLFHTQGTLIWAKGSYLLWINKNFKCFHRVIAAPCIALKTIFYLATVGCLDVGTLVRTALWPTLGLWPTDWDTVSRWGYLRIEDSRQLWKALWKNVSMHPLGDLMKTQLQYVHHNPATLYGEKYSQVNSSLEKCK